MDGDRQSIFKQVRSNSELIHSLTEMVVFSHHKYQKKFCCSCTKQIKANNYFCELITVKDHQEVIELNRYTICKKCSDLHEDEMLGMRMKY